MEPFFSFSYLLPFFGAFLGMGIAYLVRPKSPASLKLILSFSGAFLLGISIFHLLPSVFTSSNFNPGIWIVAGLIFQIILEYLSQGTEHGHTHTKSKQRLPWVLFLSLCLHAFIEGLPMASDNALVWGIFVHKIPIGMVLFIMIWELRSTLSTKLFSLFLFASMSPLGSIVFKEFSSLNQWKNTVTAFVIGMLLHISTTILFESNQGHSFNLRKLLIILLGFGFSYLL
jgi:zinc transporter ZupT